MNGTSFDFEAIGTHWNIDIRKEISPEQLVVLRDAIFLRIEEFDKTYSRFRADSLVTKMSQENGEYILPDDAELLFFLYERVYRLTEGKVTPLIGDVLIAAGYDATYSFETKKLRAPAAWDEVLAYVPPKLKIKHRTMLDFGAAGKGYLVDIVGDLLREHGRESFTVNAGGDIRHKSATHESLRVGLEHPDDPTKVIGIVELSDQSICGSAGNRRKWNGFTHIIDPVTLASPKDILATWVIADTTMVADALATCLFFVPPERLMNDFSFAYIILHSDYSVTRSADVQAEFF